MIGAALEKMYDPCILCEKCGEDEFCNRCSVTVGKKVVEDLSDKLCDARRDIKDLKYQLEEADNACEACKVYGSECSRKHNETIKLLIRGAKLEIVDAFDVKIHENTWLDGTNLVCDVNSLDDFIEKVKEIIENDSSN